MMHRQFRRPRLCRPPLRYHRQWWRRRQRMRTRHPRTRHPRTQHPRTRHPRTRHPRTRHPHQLKCRHQCPCCTVTTLIQLRGKLCCTLPLSTLRQVRQRTPPVTLLRQRTPLDTPLRQYTPPVTSPLKCRRRSRHMHPCTPHPVRLTRRYRMACPLFSFLLRRVWARQ